MSGIVLLRRGTTARFGTPHDYEVILRSTIGEGIGIFLVLNVLVNINHQDLILPGMAAVVGLHFIPMAYGIPFRAFYAVAVALLIAAEVGFMLPQPTGCEVAGLAAAAALRIASLGALRWGAKQLAEKT